MFELDWQKLQVYSHLDIPCLEQFIMSLESLKTSARSRSAKALEDLGDKSMRSSNIFWSAMPIFMSFLPSKPTESVSPTSPPPKSHRLATHSLLGIANGAVGLGGNSISDTKMRGSLQRRWPQIWTWLVFLKLLHAVTLPKRIPDDVLSPKAMPLIAFLYVLIAELDIFHNRDALEETHSDFASVALQGLITCAESPLVSNLNYKHLESALGVFTHTSSYSRKLRLIMLSRQAIYRFMILLRKLLSYQPETTHCFVQSYLFFTEMTCKRGPIVIVEFLENRFLLSQLWGVPLFFDVRNTPFTSSGSDPSDLAHLQSLWFKALETIGLHSTLLTILRVLAKSFSVIEARGYEQLCLEWPGCPANVKTRWTEFKDAIRERHALKDLWKELEAQRPCPRCNNSHVPMKMYRCSRCQEAYYCNERCQKLRVDWEDHREICLKAHEELTRAIEIPPLDDRDKHFRMWLIKENIRREEENTLASEDAYRKANPSHPSKSDQQLLVHIHHYNSFPMQREVVTADVARRMVPEDTWKSSDAVQGVLAQGPEGDEGKRQRLYVATFCKLYTNNLDDTEYVVVGWPDSSHSDVSM
ncbi:hypothetical protein D9758_006994 [Tetrapyrgos nigripes]|uniref:MYND-type domain-containing protein n=1 Tax=Tetrapyrgos nigripes TaxID=182062 RepID=A0A8H5LUY4_9AGAR|nr:hypothetical protein D9758_006994 [Tetrapyrgos nigripes]